MIYSFLYVLMTGLSTVFIQKLDGSIPPLLSLLVTSTIAVIFFNLMNFRNLKNLYIKCWQNKKLWFAIMLSISVVWSCSMIAPGKIGASLFGFLYFSSMGALGFLSLAWQDWRKNSLHLYCGLSIIALLIANIFLAFQFSFSMQTCTGVFAALLGGTACFIYFKQSQKFMRNMNLSATQVLAVRFYLTIIFSFVLFPKQNVSEYFSFSIIASLLLLAFISMIIPLYLSQKALEKITSEQNAIIMSLCPILTSVFQEIFFRDVRFEHAITYILYSITLASFYVARKYTQKMKAVA